MRFVLDHNVAITVRRVLISAGHDCWSAADANLQDATDDVLAVHAHDRKAALLSHDEEFARRRRLRTIGQHIWLRCPEPDAAEVVARHLDEVVDILNRMADVVVEVRPQSVKVRAGGWQ